MTLPRFADLDAVAAEYEREPGLENLAHILRRAALENSCASDLAQCMTCCEALTLLLASPRRKGKLDRSSTEGALLMMAVLLYTRATATAAKQGERGSIDIRNDLRLQDEALLADHDALVAIRNRALAHVYQNEVVAGEVWHHERPFLVEVPGDGWLPAAAKRSIMFEKVTFGRLNRLAPLAHKIMIAKFHASTNHLITLHNELYETKPETGAALLRHLVDPVAFFGSEQAVREALAGIPQRWAAGLAA